MYGNKPKRNIIFIAVGILLIILSIAVFVAGQKKSIISPLPKTPSFEVIFYTPTPEEQISTTSAEITSKPTLTSSP